MIKKCPQCMQQLRLPEDIGGMLMACPTCGKKFHTDFTIRAANTQSKTNKPTNKTKTSGFFVKI